jgi:hypothetical protein
MGDIEKVQPRPFKRSFSQRFGDSRDSPPESLKDAAARRLYLMSFKGMGKSIRMIEAPTHTADAPAHLSDEFPAGYSLTSCSPASLASASPAGVDSAVGLAQLWGQFECKKLNRIALKSKTV